MSSLFEALGHADVLSQFTRPGQGTIDATNQMVDAITLAPKKLILTRRASEGSASEPSLARRVSMC